MDFGGMNYLAVLAAGVAGFVFGALYYTALAKPWMAAIGKTEEEIKANMSPVPYVIAGIAQLVIAFMLAGVIGHLGTDMATVRNGLITAFFIWLGFILTTMAVNHAFQGAKRSLTVIDSGHWLGVLLVQGLVIGLFGTP
ncbi:MAG: DUF1761 domain-containing protein [Minwuiales bacterium]|nr:DUF1761 domain-containing protein [Minwuiales bacterium]